MLPRARASLAASVAIVVAGASVTAVSAAPSKAHARNVVELHALDAQIAADINAVRARRGLARLRLSHPLHAAATFHSYEMARGGFFSHDSADGASVSTRLARFYRAIGYRQWQVGETLLWYSPTLGSAGVVREWLTSPDHRAILLDPEFREIGVSAVHAKAAAGPPDGDEATIVTADFGVRVR